jgi:outer membrane protein insertion porin family
MDRLVLANQSHIEGQFRENSNILLPPYLRLYLGGSNSLRGFSQSSVGPELADGTEQGGHFLLLNNFELRYYLSYSINFVLLFDTGNLWLESGMIKLATLKNSTGAGIRYRSRFGLFRLDFAHPLNSGLPGRFHIGFGQAF